MLGYHLHTIEYRIHRPQASSNSSHSHCNYMISEFKSESFFFQLDGRQQAPGNCCAHTIILLLTTVVLVVACVCHWHRYASALPVFVQLKFSVWHVHCLIHSIWWRVWYSQLIDNFVRMQSIMKLTNNGEKHKQINEIYIYIQLLRINFEQWPLTTTKQTRMLYLCCTN